MQKAHSSMKFSHIQLSPSNQHPDQDTEHQPLGSLPYTSSQSLLPGPRLGWEKWGIGAQNLREDAYSRVSFAPQAPDSPHLCPGPVSPHTVNCFLTSITTNKLGVFQLHRNVILEHMLFCTWLLSFISKRESQPCCGVHCGSPSLRWSNHCVIGWQSTHPFYCCWTFVSQ